MPELNLKITPTDMDRLFVCKAYEHRYDLTANQYAELLLTRELRRLFPATPHYNEDGDLINGDRYKG